MRVLALLSVFVSSIASAQVIGSNPDDAIAVYVNGAAFTAIDISGGEPFDPIRTEGYRFLTLSFDYTWDSATAVTMRCKHGEESNDVNQEIHALEYTGATAASALHVWSNAVSGNEKWSWVVGLNGYRYVSCLLTATGGSSSDTITVTAKAGSH